ncbi:MAG TPA: putative molybdenum carrier protein [Kofleriaceae bacterium]|nr:putative molybdenum carrier protein [Kofleriaceae bacterium]
MIVIHSGQTGVERGAQRAAAAVGLPLGGFSSVDQRDELGPLPDEVARNLIPCTERGSRAPIRANLEIASGVIIVVPDATTPRRFTGIGVVLQAARARAVPYKIADERTDPEYLAAWTRLLPETSGAVRLMVTGPRETRWAVGAKVSWKIVAAIAMF